MSFRQGGHSDERRRRVLIDDRASASTAESAEAARLKKGKSARPGGYSAGAREENQPRITDLLPIKQRWHVLGLVSGFGCVLALQALYGCSWDWAREFGAAAAAPLDPNRHGTVAGWFASTLLGLTSLVSLLVYNLRRHKQDDYRGRYRIWLWTAALAMLASLDATSGIHYTFARGMYRFTGMGLSSQGALWPLVVFGPLYFLTGMRLLIEVWECRSAVTAMVFASLGYAVAFANTFGAIGFSDALLNNMLISTAVLLGHLALAYMSAQYARHVFLDAQGRLIAKKRKQKAKRAEKEATAEEKKSDTAAPAQVRRSDLESPANKNAASKPQQSSGNSSRDEDDDDEEASSSGQNSLQRHLSKSERKRLARQQQFQQQRKAA